MRSFSRRGVVVGLLLAAGVGRPVWAEGLAEVVAPGAQPELARNGFKYTEGPTLGPEGALYFSDIPHNRVHRLGPDGGLTVHLEGSEGANGLAFDRQGRLVFAQGERGRIARLAPGGGTPTSVAEKYGDRAFIKPNDLILDRRGGIFFTDPGRRPAPLPPQPAVYYVSPSGAVSLISEDISRPNGISLSPDEKTLYIANATGEHVIAYDVLPDGSVRNRRPFAQVRDVRRTEAGVESGADGIAVDRQGRLYVTSLIGIQVFDARGQYLGAIPVPKKPSNLAFGGPDRRTLFITAQDSVFRLKMLAQGPEGRSK